MNDKLLITILDKFSESDLSELDFTDGTIHLVLKRKTESVPDKPAPKVLPPKPPAPPPVIPAAPEGIALNQAELDAIFKKGLSDTEAAPEKIASPIVATFYAAAGPDSPPFVTVGTHVKAGATICILEAMKMMNHLEAEFDCEILEIKAATGDLVEYGQTLFEVKRI
ncbi:MAG: acetyl-CoA carboxylase biotin carboxyl carrier protein [Treponema sp.]|jgi:acetyl-CoA carboxylase biotin carboxyl carrier protein|nr:acetyl-CoA carboxylase biotin carboxyl carrier protein [Treponema sp.]